MILQCIALSASPSAHHLYCLIFSASPPVHCPQCTTFSASPSVHHLQCTTFRVSPSTHHLQCITLSASSSPTVHQYQDIHVWLNCIGYQKNYIKLWRENSTDLCQQEWITYSASAPIYPCLTHLYWISEKLYKTMRRKINRFMSTRD